MFVFLSSRLRTWLLLAVALPLARTAVRRVATSAARRDPQARTAKVLNRADSTLAALSRRRSRR